MGYCQKIPGAAWQLLAQAQWEKLTKATFVARLGQGGRLERVALEVEADGGEGVGNGGSGGPLRWPAQVFLRKRRGLRRAALGPGRLPPTSGLGRVRKIALSTSG